MSDSKWRLKFKMATNFQSAVTLVLMKCFSKFLLHFACVENEEKLWKNFFHFDSRFWLAQGVGQNSFFCHNFGSIELFFNLFFALVLCYQHAHLMEEKFLKNLDCFRSAISSSNFYRKNFFPKSKMADFSKMTSFLRKNRLFFNRVVPTLNSIFFKSSKNNSVVQIPEIYQKNCQRKFPNMAGICKMAFGLFPYMKISLVRIMGPRPA
jgi:hypothetical protein